MGCFVERRKRQRPVHRRAHTRSGKISSRARCRGSSGATTSAARHTAGSQRRSRRERGPGVDGVGLVRFACCGVPKPEKAPARAQRPPLEQWTRPASAPCLPPPPPSMRPPPCRQPLPWRRFFRRPKRPALFPISHARTHQRPRTEPRDEGFDYADVSGTPARYDRGGRRGRRLT